MTKNIQTTEDKEISLSELLLILYRNKYLIFIIIIIFIFCASFYLRIAEYTHSVELKVTPVSRPLMQILLE